MSITALSATVQKHIVNRLTTVITGSIENSPTPRVLSNFADYTSSSTIRSNTNSKLGKHESIMSRGGFEALLADMRKAVEQKTFDAATLDILNNINFDGFVQSVALSITGYADYFNTSKQRTKGDFNYSGTSRASMDTTPILATSTSTRERDVLIVKNLPHGRIVELFISYILDNSTTNLDKAALSKSLYANLQGGHLTGVFTARLIRSLGLQQSVSTSENRPIRFNRNSSSELTALEKNLDQIVSLVTDADYLSSNIIYDVELFTNTDKRLFANTGEIRLTTEVQLKSSNEEAGNLLKTAGTYLSKLIQSVKQGVSTKGQEQAAGMAYAKLLSNLAGVQKYVKDRALEVQADTARLKNNPELAKKLEKVLLNASTFEKLINTEGSPSLVKHLGSIVAAALEGKTAKNYTTILKTKDKFSSKKVSSKAPKTKPSKKGVSLVVSPPIIRTTKGQFYSLANLQILINTQLQDVVSANMGNGNDKRILNYRTGRFAASAQVERLSQSREGMISAFYSYMKNPYQTFEPGYAQGSPKTRDPKLLIGSSIKEIASTKVSNRMRAILV